jgi:hypothetical protein
LWYGVVASEGLRSVGEEALPSSKSICSILLLARHFRAGDAPAKLGSPGPWLRGEMVDVELGTNILGFPKAAYDVGIDGPRTEIVVNGYEDDTYEDVTRQICRALAVLGFRGEVRLFCDVGADEEETREIFANVGHLEGTLWLTDEYAARAWPRRRQSRPNRRMGISAGSCGSCRKRGLSAASTRRSGRS